MRVVNESIVLNQENREIGGVPACIAGCGTFCLLNVAFTVMAATAYFM